MKRIWISMIIAVCIVSSSAPAALAEVVVGPFAENIIDDQTYTGQDYDYQAKAARGGGGYRSSPGTYRGGTGTGTTPGGGYSTGPRAPSSNVGDRNRTSPGAGTAAPAPGRWGGFGSFFGGLAAGAFLGHLLNPFGGWGAGGIGGGALYPIISILFWGVLIYLTYRLVKWLFRGRVR